MTKHISSKLQFLLSDNPFYTNKELYVLLNAQTVNEQTYVRVAKNRILNKIINIPKRNVDKKEIHIPRQFVDFVRTAYPPFKALYRWQNDLFKHLEKNKYSLVVAPRDHGKSILLIFYIEYLLAVKKMDVLLLGWTDRAKEMAYYIFAYFAKNDLILDDRDIKNSPYHFFTKDGIRFDQYGVKDKAILGKHADIFDRKSGLAVIIDDPMDESFEAYKAKERDLEMRYNSTIANINPDKLIICGTRKFEGDFLEWIADKYKGIIGVFHRTPWNKDGTLLCPERWTNEKLAQKRAEIGEYMFSSEYMGDPVPLTGGVWIPDNIGYIDEIMRWTEYAQACISVDPAWTQTKESDNTAIETIFKDKLGIYTVFNDTSGHFTFDDILERIETKFTTIKMQYHNIHVIICIERNAGGIILIDLAKSRGYKFSRYIIDVRHHRSKEERIMVLEVPIKNHSIQFMNNLKDSELIREILAYPHCRRDDAIDALAMGFTELEKLRSKPFMIKRKKWY